MQFHVANEKTSKWNEASSFRIKYDEHTERLMIQALHKDENGYSFKDTHQTENHLLLEIVKTKAALTRWEQR